MTIPHFDRRAECASLALAEGLRELRPRVFATDELIAVLRAMPEIDWIDSGYGDGSPVLRAARRLGLRGLELHAALACAEDASLTLPSALALVRRTSSARRWLAAHHEFAEAWPTCSARWLATLPASFERFASLWSAVADHSRPFGSSYQPIEPYRLALLAAQMPAGRIRGALAGAGFLAVVRCMRDGEFPRLPSPQVLRQIGRGALWAARWRSQHAAPLSVRDLRLLGRLSPELRHAWLRGGLAEVGRVQRLRADPAQTVLRAALLPGRPACPILRQDDPGRRQAPGWHPLDYSREAHPGYPLAVGSVVRRLLAGQSPVEIAACPGMTRREAHDWLMLDGGRTAALTWAVTQRLRAADLTVTGEHGCIRSLRVADWLAHLSRAGRWNEVVRERVARGPDGETITWTVDGMLDEIDDADIHRLSDGASAVAERAMARMSEHELARWERDHAIIGILPAWARTLPRHMQVLRTPAALVAEGRALYHCVGGYVEAVRRGQCVIVSVCSRHGRSTIEFTPDGSVRQHRGRQNRFPHPRHAALLAAWENRIVRTTEDRHHG